ncbi:MAG: hypothetical protein Ct9H90mP8_2500 [Pseudomonadota bacterium]|nr:MAG: hypothetical protein Ct9H90mP8_2500 [Pseudomonadota bacterium]
MISLWKTFILKLTIEGLEATDRFGKKLGSLLRPGSILLLEGEMGAGKTTLAKSICLALEINPEIVNSPTYTFAHLYPGKLNVSHVDLFRIERSEELDDFDREDLICDEGYPSRMAYLFPENLLNHDPVLKLKFNITKPTADQS